MGPLGSLLLSVGIWIAPAEPAPPPTDSADEETRSPAEVAADAPLRPDDIQAAVLQSCRVALGPEGCHLLEDDPAMQTEDPTGAGAISARVVFEGDRVTVVLIHPDGPTSRILEFSGQDRREQRFTAAGLLVAAMSAAVEVQKPPPPAPHPPPVLPPEHASPSAHVPGAASSSNWLDLGLLASWGLLNLGHAGASLRFSHLWDWGGLSLEGRYSRALIQEPNIDEGALALGLLTPWGRDSGRLVFWSGAEAVVNYLAASGVRGSSDSLGAFQAGGRLHVGLGGRGPGLSPWLALDCTALGPLVEIQKNSRDLLSVPPITIGLSAGVRWNGPSSSRQP